MNAALHNAIDNSVNKTTIVTVTIDPESDMQTAAKLRPSRTFASRLPKHQKVTMVLARMLLSLNAFPVGFVSPHDDK
jgi:hypothetical protein